MAPTINAAGIYLDYNGTTPVHPRVIERVTEVLQASWGNPSSTHSPGRQARAVLDAARASISRLLGCDSSAVVFTASGSEASLMAIVGHALRCQRLGAVPLIVTQSTEHPATLAAADLARRHLGAKVMSLSVDGDGVVDPDDLRHALARHRHAASALVSIMHANNETGVIQPVSLLADVAHHFGARFHLDAAQTVGKLDVQCHRLGADLTTVVGHKFCAPKGIGALIVRDDDLVDPLVVGGGQEAGRRAGTENVAYAAGLGVAADIAHTDLASQVPARVAALRDALESGLGDRLSGRLVVNGAGAPRLPNTANVSVLDCIGSELLERATDVWASTGSACHAGQTTTSPVLSAMGITGRRAAGAVRFSLGRDTTESDVIGAVTSVVDAVDSLGSHPAPALRNDSESRQL